MFPSLHCICYFHDLIYIFLMIYIFFKILHFFFQYLLSVKLYAFGYSHYCFVEFDIDSIPFEIYFMKSIYLFFSRSSFKFTFIFCRISFQSSPRNLMSYCSIFLCVRTLSKNRIIHSII